MRAFLLLGLMSLVFAGPLAPTHLRVEDVATPSGIDSRNPVLSWQPGHTERAQRSTAFHLQIFCSSKLIWDKTEESNFTSVKYDGSDLSSNARYEWRVRWQDVSGNWSPFSAPSRFSTGLFSLDDWGNASFLGGGNEFRTTVKIETQVTQVSAFVLSLGWHQLSVNGERVSQGLMTPGWTSYSFRALYKTYDITKFFSKSTDETAIGLRLGNGWYGHLGGKPSVKILLIFKFADGTERRLESGSALWHVREGPIVSDDIYSGETFDARRAVPFDSSEYDPAKNSVDGWTRAVAISPSPISETVEISSDFTVQEKGVKEIGPVRLTVPKPNVHVFDLGQNIAGTIRMRVRGPKGASVKIRYGELLLKDGTVNRAALQRAKCEDEYILRGEGEEEIYQPTFTYHGFRYVQLAGYPGSPNLDTVTAVVIHTDLAVVGGLSFSDEILNQIHRMIIWTELDNAHSVPTASDNRDERTAWLGDAQATLGNWIYNFDSHAFLKKWLRDITDIQNRTSGTIPDVAPYGTGGRTPADPAWGTALPTVTYKMLIHYGDVATAEATIESVLLYVRDQAARVDAAGVENYYSYYGDWIAVDECPGSFVSSAMLVNDATMTEKLCVSLGRFSDAAEMANLAKYLRDQINKVFLHTDLSLSLYNGQSFYANNQQAPNALALALSLYPDEGGQRGWGSVYKSVIQRLTHSLQYGSNTHITAGFIGTKYIFEALALTNNFELAYELLTTTTYPSLGFMIKNGATTVWELYAAKSGDSMNSQSQPMLSSAGAFLYKYIAGIRVNETSPTPSTDYIVAPLVVGSLSHLSATVPTLLGPIAMNWALFSNVETGRDGLTLALSVPVGLIINFYLPMPQNLDPISAVVTESGAVIWKDQAFLGGEGISSGNWIPSGSYGGASVHMKVSSGDYKFSISGFN